jgi:hypothetical protein
MSFPTLLRFAYLFPRTLSGMSVKIQNSLQESSCRRELPKASEHHTYAAGTKRTNSIGLSDVGY